MDACKVIKTMTAKEIFEKNIAEGRLILNVQESKEILRDLGFPVNETYFCSSFEEVTRATENVGFPCVLKIVSPDIIHKTEAGGVVTIYSQGEVTSKYGKMVASAKDFHSDVRISGFLVEEMITEGIEVIIGGIEDESFGKTLMFGLGGIFVELYKDVSFRLIPVARKDAETMINEIKASKVLDGYRGRPKANKNALIELLMKTSDLIEENPLIREIDLNPVFLSARATIVDARIILAG